MIAGCFGHEDLGQLRTKLVTMSLYDIINEQIMPWGNNINTTANETHDGVMTEFNEIIQSCNHAIM